MLVDVVRMRHNGEKIPRDALLKMVPTRGYLEYYPGYATLSLEPNLDPRGGGFHGEALTPLTEAKVTKINARGMVIVGLERLKPWHLNIRLPQAWWVRFVGESRDSVE